MLQWRRCHWILRMNASDQLSSKKTSMVVSSKHVNKFVLTYKGNMDSLKEWEQLTSVAHAAAAASSSAAPAAEPHTPLPPQPLPS